MYQAEALTKTVDLSQTTSLSTVEYFIYLPCSEIGVLENHLIVIKTWKKKGAMEKLLSCLKKSTLESLLRAFGLAHRYTLSILKVLFFLPQRCLFNMVDAFSFFLTL